MGGIGDGQTNVSHLSWVPNFLLVKQNVNFCKDVLEHLFIDVEGETGLDLSPFMNDLLPLTRKAEQICEITFFDSDKFA